MTVQVLIGDCRDVLRSLPAESVHCVVTSPPYFGLRDYGVAGQIGLEPSPAEFIATMVEVFREVRRVLRADGTCWLNLGDSYSDGGSGANGRQRNAPNQNWDGDRDTKAPRGVLPAKRDGAKSKDLLMIPARVALALQADGWWLRSDIIWSKPNPMPESVTDRPTSAHEHVFLLAKSARYFYDADAVREASIRAGDTPGGNYAEKGTAFQVNGGWAGGQVPSHRNLRNVWTIATAPFSEAHFATFPPALVEPCIKAGTSERGCCPACGAPWVREVEKSGGVDKSRPLTPKHALKDALGVVHKGQEKSGMSRPGWRNDPPAVSSTLGWSPSCSCPPAAPIPCTVLDPFGGAGTTGLVADRLQRHAILIELNPHYAAMARRRITSDAPLLQAAQ